MQPSKQDKSPEAGALPIAHSLGPFLDTVFEGLRALKFAIRFWDGSVWTNTPGENSVFELWLRNSAALQSLLTRCDDVSLGEAFIDGDVYVNGDLFEVMRAWPQITACLRVHRHFSLSALRTATRRLSDSYSRLLQLGRRHSKPRDRAAAAFTFDQPPDFYEIFLGKSMLYSSGWFDAEHSNLQAAQEEKLQRVSKKLSFAADQRFLDVGCGWGTMIVCAAKSFGVRCLGISLSRKQVNFATNQIREQQLGSYCQVDQREYRDLDIIHLLFERACSLRTLEYVGQKNLDSFFESVFRTLVPGGLFLEESVTRSVSGPFSGEHFADRFTFPDRELLSLTSIMEAAKQTGFEIVSVEDWREHCVKTFRCWLNALNSQELEAQRHVDKHHLRSWKFYFAAIAAALDRSELSAHQVLLRRPQ